jgi:ethanolamine ammonia-lyase large subunit
VTKPNFEEMTIKQLRNYVLQHRTDDDALHALGQRIHAEGKRLNSMEELKESIQQKRQAGIEP